MRKSTPIWIAAAVLLCLAGGLALAEQDQDAKEKPSAPIAKEKAAEIEKMSGKELYKAYCKQCHGPESEHGEYAPMTLIQEQWERFFDEDYIETHKDVADSTRDGSKVTEQITEKMLEKIREFCTEGAADSEHPATCG